MAQVTRVCRIEDPRGLEVTLTPPRWNRHLIVHHPDMAGRLKEVLDTVQDPEVIQLSLYDPEVHLYYRRKAKGFGKFSHLFVEVVVRVDLEHVSGDRVTAPFTNALDKGRVLWARKR